MQLKLCSFLILLLLPEVCPNVKHYFLSIEMILVTVKLKPNLLFYLPFKAICNLLPLSITLCAFEARCCYSTSGIDAYGSEQIIEIVFRTFALVLYTQLFCSESVTFHTSTSQLSSNEGSRVSFLGCAFGHYAPQMISITKYLLSIMTKLMTAVHALN